MSGAILADLGDAVASPGSERGSDPERVPVEFFDDEVDDRIVEVARGSSKTADSVPVPVHRGGG